MPANPSADYTSFMMLEYRIPSITAYNRLEASPRTLNFDRSLKAEVRDALWMLTRQWQFGEFQGEDAATPVTAQILGEHTTMDRVGFPKGAPFPFLQAIPLETHVERETLVANLSLAVEMGHYFLRLMRANGLAGFRDALLTAYPLNYIINPNDTDAVQLLQAVKDKIFDGFTLHGDMFPTGGATAFEAWLTAYVPNDVEKTTFRTIAGQFVAWHQRNYSQPVNAEDSAWLPSQLEYSFALASAQKNQVTLTADQYYEGHLDWYSFDIDLRRNIRLPKEPEGDSRREHYASFIPNPIAFKGMPNARFWKMEEAQTDFGKIDTSPTGLLHLLLAEFGLIYSNDWFMLPYPLNVNTLCEIKGIVVTDVFGQEIYVRPAGKGQETNWHRWAMFHHTTKQDTGNRTNLFYLVPALTKTLESPPLEEVNFLRDEMANMVWAVENIVPSHTGKGVRGAEMAITKLPSTPFVPAGTAEIRYVLGTTVPDNWTPFIPVHMPGSDTEIRFQRARMPGANGAFGVLLNEQPAPYFINEEEVPRAGVIVRRSFQRTRWLQGKTLLWTGRLKEAGKGEGWSNLKFDQIEDIL